MKLPSKFFFGFCFLSLMNSCRHEYYSVEDFLTVKKIDTHIHLNGESTALTKQAQNDNFSLLTINVEAPHYPDLEEQLRIALLHIEYAPQHIWFVSTFSINGWDSHSWSDQIIRKLKSDFANGALGVKVWKNIGMVAKDTAGNFIMIDNPKFDTVINYIVQEDKTVLGHLGEPKNCWLPLDQMTVNNDRTYFKEHPEYHMYLHPEFPSYEEQIAARDRFLGKHPDLRFVAAHLGSLEWDVDELAKRLDKFPNMAVDMAARIAHLQHQCIGNYDKVRNFMIKYQDRIIYATDANISISSDPEIARKQLHETWMDDWKYFVTDETMRSPSVAGEFKGLRLPKKVIDKIYRTNAIHWFKIPQ